MNKTALTKPSSGTASASNGYIVLGIDASGKAKAARFPASDLDLATAAAASLKLAIYEADKSPQIAALAKRLPLGRIYAKGKAFVPFIKRDIYDQLDAALGHPAGRTIQTPRGPVTLNPSAPKSLDAIKVGDVVLAPEGIDEGYWEALVTSRTGDELVMSFLYYSRVPEFKARLQDVTLLPSAYKLETLRP